MSLVFASLTPLTCRDSRLSPLGDTVDTDAAWSVVSRTRRETNTSDSSTEKDQSDDVSIATYFAQLQQIAKTITSTLVKFVGALRGFLRTNNRYKQNREERRSCSSNDSIQIHETKHLRMPMKRLSFGVEFSWRRKIWTRRSINHLDNNEQRKNQNLVKVFAAIRIFLSTEFSTVLSDTDRRCVQLKTIIERKTPTSSGRAVRNSNRVNMWSPEVFNLNKFLRLSLPLKDKLLFDDIFDGFLPADVLKSEIGRSHRQLLSNNEWQRPKGDDESDTSSEGDIPFNGLDNVPPEVRRNCAQSNQDDRFGFIWKILSFTLCRRIWTERQVTSRFGFIRINWSANDHA